MYKRWFTTTHIDEEPNDQHQGAFIINGSAITILTVFRGRSINAVLTDPTENLRKDDNLNVLQTASCPLLMPNPENSNIFLMKLFFFSIDICSNRTSLLLSHISSKEVRVIIEKMIYYILKVKRI
jgi:hypothetical protein